MAQSLHRKIRTISREFGGGMEEFLGQMFKILRKNAAYL